MKRLIFILPVVLLAACASRTPKKIVVVPAIVPSQRVQGVDNVRRAEEVSEYRFGRYVDPGSRLVMHEGHPVYRIERSAAWNLHPDGSSKPTRTTSNAPVATTTPDDAVVAEINKQKAATKAFTEQTATLNQRLSALAEAVAQTKQLAEQQLLQQRDIATLKTRLNAVEKERANKPTNSSTNKAAPMEESW